MTHHAPGRFPDPIWGGRARRAALAGRTVYGLDRLLTTALGWEVPVAYSRVIGGRVPDPLYEGARRALGLPEDVRDSDLIRAAFARLAGIDVTQHTPKYGTRPGFENREADPVT